MPRILILTEAGSNSGYGHLSRCSALAQAFAVLSWETLLIAHTDTSIPNHTSDWQSAPWRDDPTVWMAEIGNADLVVVDSYRASTTTLRALARKSRFLARIDDFPRHSLSCSAIIDWSVNAEKYAYPEQLKDVLYLLGCRYACLRQPFWNPVPRTTERFGRILLMFGGSDIPALTEQAVQALLQTSMDLEVVTPNSHCVSVPEVGKLNLHSGLSAVEIFRLMRRCDIAVTGGGQTLYELAACGTPAIALELATNQYDDLVNFSTTGFADYVGHWRDSDIWSKVLAAVDSLNQSPEERHRRAAYGQQLVDGQGAMRLATELSAAAGIGQ